ncbi:unnamed protein product [Psylliodes chrysocephalus]|uniref:Uncharacterized protein n=1 Tax=Psylliodes chrysocephalus TaxID=3402493 RepID=A0A9P0D3D7_9CUCU|nr:unnamed protein product [Psylliodes chrysocephala]
MKNLEDKQKLCDQLRRSKNVIFYGVRETNNRTNSDIDIILEIINSKLNVALDKSNINCCFRMKTADKNNIKPILVQFCSSVHTKKVIFYNKKLLKGINIIIREDLTPDKLQIFKAMIEKVNKNGKIWTNNGEIFFKSNGSDVVKKIKEWHDVNAIGITR